MKSAVEQLSPTRVKLSIDVTFDELKPHISAAYQTLSERINIPGFRKGKVPAAMIDQRVGRGIAERVDPAALSGQSLRPLGRRCSVGLGITCGW